jgi:uncharacterized membrane protein YcaP (DUF421 family)
MDSVVRAVTIYLLLLVLFRLTGKRTMAQITPFDMILLLIISEATQNYMVGQDYSFTNAALLIITLIGVDIALSVLKQRSRQLGRLLDDEPIVIVRDGQLLRRALSRERVDEEDILRAARSAQGIDRLEDIRLALLETDGEISVIPRKRD